MVAPFGHYANCSVQHVIVMDQGRVVYQGGPENLNDDSWVHQMLGVSGGHK